MMDIILGVGIWWVLLGVNWYFELREGTYSKKEIALFHVIGMVGIVLMTILIFYFPVRIV